MSGLLKNHDINALIHAALCGADVKLIEGWRHNVPTHGEIIGMSCIIPPEPTIDDFDNIYESVRHRIIQTGLYPYVSIRLTKMTDKPWFAPAGLHHGLHDIIRPDGPSESWYTIHGVTHLFKREMGEL